MHEALCFDPGRFGDSDFFVVALLIYGAIDPTANPIGAGLLAGAGSLLGLVITAFGLSRLVSRKVSQP